MCSDFDHALEDVLCGMEEAGEEGDGEAAESSSNVPAGGHFSFAGFGNAFTMARGGISKNGCEGTSRLSGRWTVRIGSSLPLGKWPPSGKQWCGR